MLRNLKNMLTLTTRVRDFNVVAQHPEQIEQFRKLTLTKYSGLNYELTRLLEDSKIRNVNCKVLTVHCQKKLVAWGLLSKEDSKYLFINSKSCFKKEDGWLFQLFVSSNYRRRGIGTNLVKRARKIVKQETLCVCPWNDASVDFFNSTHEILTKWL